MCSMEEANIMPNPAERLRLKDRIIESIGRAVKHIQTYQYDSIESNDSHMRLSNGDWQFHKLVEHLDHALLHGLRHITNGYWVVVREFTHKSTVRDLQQLQNVTTNLGRGRAWLYLALNDHLLESYTRCLLDNDKLVRKYYVNEALVLDQQRMQILLTLTAGVETINFQLDPDMPYLDLCSYRKSKKSEADEAEEALALRSMDMCGSLTSASGSYKQDNVDVFLENSIALKTNRSYEQLCSHKKELVRTCNSLPNIEIGAATGQRMQDKHTSDAKTTEIQLKFDDNCDIEVIHIKSKTSKGRKKYAKKKQGITDPERISVTSSNSNNSVQSGMVSSSLTTPESGYRSNLDFPSLKSGGDKTDCVSDNVMISSSGTDVSSNFGNTCTCIYDSDNQGIDPQVSSHDHRFAGGIVAGPENVLSSCNEEEHSHSHESARTNQGCGDRVESTCDMPMKTDDKCDVHDIYAETSSFTTDPKGTIVDCRNNVAEMTSIAKTSANHCQNDKLDETNLKTHMVDKHVTLMEDRTVSKDTQTKLTKKKKVPTATLR